MARIPSKTPAYDAVFAACQAETAMSDAVRAVDDAAHETLRHTPGEPEASDYPERAAVDAYQLALDDFRAARAELLDLRLRTELSDAATRLLLAAAALESAAEALA
jgi:hypothetical protein